MNLIEFQEKWRGATLKESASAREHFLDLCRLLGVPTPVEVDKTGEEYAFEKGATKDNGGQGFADVWYRNHFAWEYKGPKGDLAKAYQQLRQYVEALENPPLLVVSDLARFEIHTNFTSTRKELHAFTLDELGATAPGSTLSNLQKLRALWTEPEALRPKLQIAAVTEEAAARFGELAKGLHAQGHDPHRIAHYLMQLLFCLFAEDVNLLPKGLFSTILAFGAKQPAQFEREIRGLLTAMAAGGFSNLQSVPRFNGGLFADVDPLPLSAPDLAGEPARGARLRRLGGLRLERRPGRDERRADPGAVAGAESATRTEGKGLRTDKGAVSHLGAAWCKVRRRRRSGDHQTELHSTRLGTDCRE